MSGTTTEQLRKTRNAYSKRIGTILARRKKLLKAKDQLVNFQEPVLILQRTNGEIELYHNVKETEWLVPNTADGVEKKLLLGRQWQIDFPYAGRTFKAYLCHEDWVFPHIWGKPTQYQGPEKNAPKEWILTSANIASEIFRDRERKVLMAWEKFRAQAGKKDWVEIAKAIGIVIAVIVGLMWAWSQFGPQPSPPTIVGSGVTIT